MSSFSSVVRKTGTSIKPKSQPRRTVSRQSQQPTQPTTDDSNLANWQANREIEINRSTTAQDNDSQRVGVAQVQPTVDVNTAQESESRVSPDPSIAPSTGSKTRRSGRLTALVPTDVPSQISATTATLAEPDVVDPEHTALRLARNDDRRLRIDGHPRAVDNQENSTSAEPPSKRRKITPRPTTSPSPSRNTGKTVPHHPTRSARQSSIHDTVDTRPSADLIQSATEQAASVSTLANDIDSQIRALTQRRSKSTVTGTGPDATSGDTDQSLVSNLKTSKRKKKSAAEQAADVIANIVGETENGTRKRDTTPEGAEQHELEPDLVTMGELVQDRKLGKKSQLEEDMQRDWEDIVKRRKEAREHALENAQKGRRKGFGSLTDMPAQATVALGPRTEIRNGRIVVIEESRQIDRNGALEQAAVLDAENVREDKFYYKRVNQNTVGMKAYAGRKFRWDQESTEQFYKGLQMFGTDFLMIANMFPGIDRKQVKKKFIREENADKMKVRQALADKIPIDLDEYAKITDTTLQDPEDLQAELDAEEERLKEEDHQRRVREGFVSANPADNPIPTTEGDGTAPAEDPAGNESRFASVAEEVMAPKKRQRKAGSSVRKRGPKAGRRPAEGIEEMLGSIDEVRV